MLGKTVGDLFDYMCMHYRAKDMIVSGGFNVKSIDFMDSIPLTPLGKANKKALREIYWKGKGRRVG